MHSGRCAQCDEEVIYDYLFWINKISTCRLYEWNYVKLNVDIFNVAGLLQYCNKVKLEKLYSSWKNTLTKILSWICCSVIKKCFNELILQGLLVRARTYLIYRRKTGFSYHGLYRNYNGAAKSIWLLINNETCWIGNLACSQFCPIFENI